MSKPARRAAGRRSPARAKSALAGSRPKPNARAKARKKAKVRTKAPPRPRRRDGARAAAHTPTVDPFYLKLDADCTLREATDLQFSLLAASGDPMVVDGGAVERVDTAGLQLLVALARRQQQAGRRLSWKAASPILLKCGERLGLIDALGLAAVAAGNSQ
jgi:phospholipid transport system transporter-binding protein